MAAKKISIRKKSSPEASLPPLPALTEKETLVWQACMAHDDKWPGCYVPHTDILEGSGLAPCSLGGVIASLQKKVYLFAWNGSHADDVELTCWARKAYDRAKKKYNWCNHHKCICKS